MIAVLIGAITGLLAALILSQRLWPEFRRRAEAPKYRFLATLGVPPPPAGPSDSRSSGKERHP